MDVLKWAEEFAAVEFENFQDLAYAWGQRLDPIFDEQLAVFESRDGSLGADNFFTIPNTLSGAIKHCNLNKLNPDDRQNVIKGFFNEYFLRRMVSSYYIPPMFALSVSNEHCMLLTQDCGTSLLTYLPGPQEIPRIMFQLAIALSDLHSAKIVHGDIHPKNIVQDMGWSDLGEDEGYPTTRLIDLGGSAYIGKLLLQTTRQYWGPEADGDPSKGIVAHPANDIYAYGNTIAWILSGHQVNPASIGIAPVLGACLDEDPTNRPTASEIVLEIESLFVQKSPVANKNRENAFYTGQTGLQISNALQRLKLDRPVSI